jgi:hypothetical protein
MSRLRPRHRLIAAFTLLGILCLGSAAHGWHHFTDAACGESGEHGAQPCACAALHGGVVAAEPQLALTVQPTAPADVFPDAPQRPLAPALVAGTPRAPPVS